MVGDKNIRDRTALKIIDGISLKSYTSTCHPNTLLQTDNKRCIVLSYAYQRRARSIKDIVSATLQGATTKEDLHALESRLDKRLSSVDLHARVWTTALEGQLGTKLAGVEARLEEQLSLIDKKIDTVQANLKQAIRKSQEDTIEALTDVINTGYDMLEKRVTRLEEHAGISES